MTSDHTTNSMTLQEAFRSLWGRYGKKGVRFTIETHDHYGADPDFTVRVQSGGKVVAECHGSGWESEAEDEANSAEQPFDFDREMERSLVRAINKVVGGGKTNGD